MRSLAKVILLSACLALAGGCEDPVADMGDQPHHDPYDASRFYADGKGTRLPVPGTVAQNANDAEDLPASPTIPFAITRGDLERGQQQFNIYCIQCHGRLGNGEGMVVQRGFTRPPSYHIQRLKQSPDSHFYNVMTHGYGAMYRFNDVITPDDRWRIVAYIRALQAASDAPNLSDAERAALIARGDREAAPPTGGTAP